MRITGLRLRQLTGIMEHEQPFWEERLARPIDVYPEHKARTAADGYWMPQPIEPGRSRVISVFLEIDTDEGVTGLAGPIPHEVAWVIDREFRGLLQDIDPLATERVWDLMYREAVHGRKGTTMMAISAIDCALWDLKGRWLQQPVYRLLGGPVRPSAPAYASMLGYSIEPELAHKRTREKVAEGFRALKWFPRWGPTDGREGMARNIELAETLRDAAGPDVDIMLDAWMTWNRPYTLEFARRVAHLDIRWIEEPVMPDKIELCAEIRHLSPVPIATGEHEYTRWGQKALLDAGAADVLQADTFWAGGLSEMVKICTLASTYDIPVIAHGHSVPANTHLTMATPELLAPMVEYLVKWNELLQFFWQEPVKPVDGMISVSDRPGLGVEIDPDKIESEEALQWSSVPNMTGSVQTRAITEGEQPMRANHVRRRLAAGEPSIGTWLSLPSPEAAEYVSRLGFDWLVVDTEHNPIDIRTLAQMFAAMAASSTAPMVRIPWNSPENFKRVLDAGAWGVVVPMVNSREEAEQAVSAARYYPDGSRSVGGGRFPMSFDAGAEEYFRNANDQILVVLQIEHIQGVENADAILSVPGVDACFIGPNDLAASMGMGLGVPLESDEPRLVEAITEIRNACVRNGVAPGIHTSGAAGVNQRIAEGFQFCALASELRYMLSGLRADLAELNWTRADAVEIGDGVAGAAVRY